MADSNQASAPAKMDGSSANNAAPVSATGDRHGGSEDRGRGRGRGRGGRGGRGRGQSNGRGRGGGRGGFSRSDHKGSRESKGEMGRGAWERTGIDKRQRNNEQQEAKRRKIEEEGGEPEPGLFTKEEIEAEVRKPKRKVAVMIGYAGTGYKGMQINTVEKTIEGDIFQAFIKAGAISKANADDPKKSNLVRCARTDKGVHAAGNVISLKLIVEDPNTVQNINAHLPPQIRVWGIERTNGAFSCYQTCDSRWYEYLIPTYSFLPPHPASFLGKKLVESAEQEGVYESYKSRQEEVATWWENVDKEFIHPILDKLDPKLREHVMQEVYAEETEKAEPKAEPKTESQTQIKTEGKTSDDGAMELNIKEETATEDSFKRKRESEDGEDQESKKSKVDENLDDIVPANVPNRELTPKEKAVKEIKAAYTEARKTYRIDLKRKDRVQEALSQYLGTHNFHNYTIQKSHKDPSANRVIRSFNVGEKPIIINDTEWLSLKVHGQSFMMHQIRKMVAMVALIVRCGCSPNLIRESYGPVNISIPKAPGLGLLLERPVFDSYNAKAVTEYERAPLDFNKYTAEMEEFKQREIYDRIFREENALHHFHVFFNHLDSYKSDYFLWVTSGGIGSIPQRKGKDVGGGAKDADSDDERGDANGQEG